MNGARPKEFDKRQIREKLGTARKEKNKRRQVFTQVRREN